MTFLFLKRDEIPYNISHSNNAIQKVSKEDTFIYQRLTVSRIDSTLSLKITFQYKFQDKYLFHRETFLQRPISYYASLYIMACMICFDSLWGDVVIKGYFSCMLIPDWHNLPLGHKHWIYLIGAEYFMLSIHYSVW